MCEIRWDVGVANFAISSYRCSDIFQYRYWRLLNSIYENVVNWNVFIFKMKVLIWHLISVSLFFYYYSFIFLYYSTYWWFHNDVFIAAINYLQFIWSICYTASPVNEVQMCSQYISPLKSAYKTHNGSFYR